MKFTRYLGMMLCVLSLFTAAAFAENTTSSATTNDATAIAASSAQLNGVLVPGTAGAVAGWFEWGTTTAFGKRTDPQIFSNPAATITLVATISNLEPHTTYYFRTVMYGAVAGGATINGSTKSFTTGGDAPPATTSKVTATTGDATGLTSSGATLNGILNPGGGTVSAWFDWGTSSSLGNRTDVQTVSGGTSNAAITFSLKNLQPHTVYYFRLDGYRSSDGAAAVGDIKTFTTADAPAAASLTVTTTDATGIMSNSATLNGKITAGGTSLGAWFEYGTTSALGTRTDAQTFPDSATTISLTQTLSRLQPNTTYYFRTVAQNSSGTVRGDVKTFSTTRVPSTAPEKINDVETGQIKSGYLIVTPDAASDAPTVTFTYGIISQGSVQSQAGVIPTMMATDASMFVEIIPSISRNIGVAIANPGGTANAVTLTLRDESGIVLGSPANVSVPAHQQVAKFVSQVFGADVISNGFRGSLRMQSATPFAVAGLRFSGAIFSTLPVAITATVPGVPTMTLAAGTTLNSPEPGTVGGGTAVIVPQFAIAGGWATQIALVNNTNATLVGRIDVFDTNGNPMPVPLNGETRSTYTYSIPVGGTFVLAPRDSNGQSPL